jgi:hypothetical protein
MMQLQFSDKMVPYTTFVNDVAARLADMIAESRADPEVISQREAYHIFGRGNVDRWRRQGRISPCKRPGKVEYLTRELRLLQRTQQDYLQP